MSKYNLEEIHISNVKENMSADDQARFDNLTKDDQLKLEKIFSMMKAEKDAKKSTNEDFDSVVDKIKDSGKSEEDAKKIAGAINAKYVGNYREGVEESDAADYTEEIAEENDEDKLPMDEDKYDDIVDADSDIPADKKKAAALAYRKVDKGDSYEKATSHIKEVRVDSEVAERIEGLLNRDLKRKFLFAFEDLYSDLIEEDPFHAEDVINHLNNEMYKQLQSYQDTGDKFAGMEEGAMQPGEGDLESGETGNMDALDEAEPIGLSPGKSEKGADGKMHNVKASNSERKMAMRRVIDALTTKGDEKGFKISNDQALEFIRTHKDDIFSGDIDTEDVEDIWMNYNEYESINTDSLGEATLKEHFGRFMKDYQ
mgnify:FL=1|jgi:hypothetical protein|tara:strand:- start:734 stop:1843 length:1110 start_codon:yes stop_codon:yes gene_type:complete